MDSTRQFKSLGFSSGVGRAENVIFVMNEMFEVDLAGASFV